MKRKIQDIAPLLAPDFIEFKLNEAMIVAHNRLLEEAKDRLGRLHNYVPLLHDSRVLDLTTSAHHCSLLMSVYSRYAMACALIDKKGLHVDKERLIFPLAFDFKVKTVTYNRVDADGTIVPIPPEPVSIYTHMQVISNSEQGVELGMVFFQEPGKNPGKFVLLLLTATSIKVTEKQDDNWHQYFGDEYDHYLDYYKEQKAKGAYVSDSWICGKLIDELDRSRH
ncbi:MAG: hypothetical protein R6U66_04060 [Bacteroidales bacterium]|jgi:hypothetical protein